MKLNVYCDGSYLNQYAGILKKCGVGVVIKDCYNHIIYSRGKVVDTHRQNDYEVRAIGYAISLVKTLIETKKINGNYNNIIIYSDYKNIVNDMNCSFDLSKKISSNSFVQLIRSNIKHIESKYGLKVYIKYIDRELNKEADELAGESISEYTLADGNTWDYMLQDLKLVIEKQKHRIPFLSDSKKDNEIKYVFNEVSRLIKMLEISEKYDKECV